MGIKGASSIKGVRSINTRPGPTTESKGLLKLYLLAAEKENLRKKLDWSSQQSEQAAKRLDEIASRMQAIQKAVEKRATSKPASGTHITSCSQFIKY